MRTKSLFERTVVIFAYLSSSAATFDLNKYIVGTLNFKMHYMLIVFQSLVISLICLIQLLCSNTLIQFRNLKKWIPTSILLTLMMFTGMKAVYYFPLSLFTLYKNLSIILVAVLELYFFDNPITVLGFVSFILMISSSFFGNTVDKVALVGYAWMVFNVFSTSIYVIYLKKLMVVDRTTRTESVFFTNAFSIPLLLALSLIFDSIEVPTIDPWILGSSIILSGVSAYFTSFSTAWSVKVLSSTSYSMLGAMNKLIVSASGFLFFNEQYDVTKMLALLVGVVSGMIYSIDSIKK